MLDYHYYSSTNEAATHTLVLLHGIGGNSNIFYKQLDMFCAHFHVLCIDLPGHGDSPCVHSYEDHFNYDIVVREVEKTMEALNIQRAHFVGISLGSIVIHHLLQKAPERVLSAVLGGTITRFNAWSKGLLVIGQAIKHMTPHMWIYRLFAHVMMPKGRHAKSRSLFIREAKKMTRRNFFTWFTLIQNVEQTYKYAHRSPVPKLYISGEEDHLFVRALLKDIQRDIHAKALVLKKCGHVCNIEKAQAFNEAAIAFVHAHSKPELTTASA
ncbi:alpha/beta fold hydrolase [Caryophanon latum]|uniref:Beta-ketoadipate enol-lactone hydrolase n=1 Tax=Caryophanon latum TaxID=33977 RepID=A0A1C0YX58_9BACL|nr:alpha/beta hydrolase [Caryophanon latum]OCS91749.1 beta-ketoadipate enol-lactone hydrolase [Caryophanon latum]